MSTATRPPSPPPGTMIDHNSYPHILDRIAAACEPEALLGLRATSSSWKLRADRLFVHRVRISVYRRGTEQTLAMEYLRDSPNGTVCHRLPLMMPPPDKDEPPPNSWAALGPYVTAVDLVLGGCWPHPRLGFIETFRHFSAVSTLRDYTNLSTDENEHTVPASNVYVCRGTFPRFHSNIVRPGGRIVFNPTPPWFIPWDSLSRIPEVEVILNFGRPRNFPTALQRASYDSQTVLQRLVDCLRLIPDVQRPQITAVNLDLPCWRVPPDPKADDPWSALAALKDMDCFRFQTQDEYISRVGEDQVRLELGPSRWRELVLGEG